MAAHHVALRVCEAPFVGQVHGQPLALAGVVAPKGMGDLLACAQSVVLHSEQGQLVPIGPPATNAQRDGIVGVKVEVVVIASSVRFI